MSQLDYTIDQQAGFEGELADLSLKDVETGLAEGEVLIGKLVTQGTVLGQVKHPTTAAGITDKKLVKGVAVHHHAMESSYPNGSGTYSYLDKAAVNVGRKVRVWVKPENVVTASTSVVEARYAGVGDKGAFRAGNVAGETAAVPEAKFRTSTTAIGQLAILEIDL